MALRRKTFYSFPDYWCVTYTHMNERTPENDSLELTERQREAIQYAIDNDWESAKFFEPLLDE